MTSVPLWIRPHFTPLDRAAEVVLFVLADDPLPTDAPMDSGEQGLPAEVSLESIDVQRNTRETVEGLLRDFRRAAERGLGDAAALDSARLIYRVRVQRQDPPDLGHLQGAWAVTRWLCSLGARAVLDGFPIQWKSATEVLSWRPDRPFSIEREVSVIFESEARVGSRHLLHTRGMGKFARFDLLTLIERRDQQRAGQVLLGLAQAQALGHVPRLDRESWVTGTGGGRLVPYAPDVNAPEVNLNNDGLLLEHLTLES